ncbi:hypothetical protein P9314_01510 [Paenibacillus validus]|uniref:Uncharacterized protein n=1 Tax=Paenibacillus validus TaxID=44253 RepID=A0A7X3CR06_9BACL|nr:MULTISPECIES: hypothetical protein [Paenibacillus]MED4599390.1 hypothetical protein [Paenibacillus validus]MED4606298.1 hypothetical protein [Paenibacillus validus]MUG70180.1 hypothetical protein [Paenibacillus validus]
MDCPRCHGNGELESSAGSGASGLNEEKHYGADRERGAWPATCPTCEGSGYLEESM